MRYQTFHRVVALCLGFAMAPGCWAGAGTDQLNAFFKSVRIFQADFEQSVVDDRHTRVQSSKGKVAIKRPGLFRWDYDKPYRQQIVGDGAKVWIYDQDLEQVTVKAQGEALGSTPAQLLSSAEPLEKTFVVTDVGEKDNAAWVELLPRASDTVFKSIRLGFSQQNLVGMELNDNLGNRTTLRFMNIEYNPTVDAELFKFTAPPGVDVVGN